MSVQLTYKELYLYELEDLINFLIEVKGYDKKSLMSSENKQEIIEHIVNQGYVGEISDYVQRQKKRAIIMGQILDMTAAQLALKYTEEQLQRALEDERCLQIQKQRLQDALDLCEQGYIEIKKGN